MPEPIEVWCVVFLRDDGSEAGRREFFPTEARALKFKTGSERNGCKLRLVKLREVPDPCAECKGLGDVDTGIGTMPCPVCHGNPG